MSTNHVLRLDNFGFIDFACKDLTQKHIVRLPSLMSGMTKPRLSYRTLSGRGFQKAYKGITQLIIASLYLLWLELYKWMHMPAVKGKVQFKACTTPIVHTKENKEKIVNNIFVSIQIPIFAKCPTN